MFGGSKPTFGAGTTSNAFGGFNNTTTSSPFGQSAFGKPATSAFGSPAFGAQQTTPSLFGTSAAQTQSTNLFGGANTSSAFGTTTTAQPTFGAFSQPQQNTSIFGGTQNAATAGSLFGQASTSAFGSTVKPGGLGAFGQSATQSASSLFGQPASSTATTGFGSFGQPSASNTNVFAGATSAFGQPNAAGGTNAGTSIVKYQPTIGQDTLMKGGQANNVNTKQHCITAMKEYEAKSLEELRMEDYLANRKGPQAGTSTNTGFFGSAAQPSSGTGLFGSGAQQSTGLFGQPAGATADNKSVFGTSAFGQPSTSAFGGTQQQNTFMAKPFGAPATTFGGTAADASANVFGPKPAFGQAAAPSLFGQTPATSAAPAFGQASTGFGGFGSTAGTQQPSLFGNTATDANKPAFGLGAPPAANSGFFGSTAANPAGGNIFGAKPATGFGSTPGFGTPSAPNTGFTNFSMSNNTGGLFNSTLNKPATSGFGGFGAQPSTAPLNFNAGQTGPSLFGNTAAKPGGLFGSTLGSGTNPAPGGLFGGGTSAFGGNTTLGGSFGTGTLGGPNTTLGGLGNASQQQPIPIHQQILSKVTSPYGDNPIFKDLRRDEVDATRATNPAAQKALLESTQSPSNQFKVLNKPSPSLLKIKPVGSALTKKSLFEGLEELDSSVETFTLKPNAKRLVLTPKELKSPSVAIDNHSVSTQLNLDSPKGSMRRHVETSINPILTAARNEPFTGEIPTEPKSTSTERVSASAALIQKDDDNGRRESWLHPNNLEKVRQQNMNVSVDSNSPLNSTLTDLVPRKPLETYRNAPTTARLSLTAVPENPFEDQSSTTRRDTLSGTEFHHDCSLMNASFNVGDRSNIEESQPEYEEHPTGITLRRAGYYTIPSLDDLKSYIAEDGSCIVPNFTIGREGYGNVYFNKEMDVAGINLDEIVHFRNKEIIVYPDDDNKPEMGCGLNRDAQVTLDKVWPYDKVRHEIVKDPQALIEMDWEARLRRACEKNDTRFIEFRPETGSWVFRVKHFSKYGLSDSDEDDNLPTDPKKPRLGVPGSAGVLMPNAVAARDKASLGSLKNAQKMPEEITRSQESKTMGAASNSFYPMDESAEFMLFDKTQYYQNNGCDYPLFDHMRPTSGAATSPTALLAKQVGTDAHKLQLMKASFFGEEDTDNKSVASDMVAPHSALNRNFRSPFFGLRGHELLSSSQSLWKDAVRYDGYSVGSSQMDFDSQGSQPEGSSSISILSVLREEATETSSVAPCSDIMPATFVQVIKPPPFIVKPRVATIRTVCAQIPLHKSITYKYTDKWINELGYFKGVSFKFNFGPKNMLVLPTTKKKFELGSENGNQYYKTLTHILQPRTIDDYSSTIVQRIEFASMQRYDDFEDSILEHLRVQLENSTQEHVEGSNCSQFKADNPNSLIEGHLEIAMQLITHGSYAQYVESVWSLCHALWAEHDEISGFSANSHRTVMFRRELLSEWLEDTLTEKDLLTRSVTKSNYLEHLWDLIMCQKVEEACELAISCKDIRLALLMAQLGSGPDVRNLMEDQLASWFDSGADEFIDVGRLKLYMLVAGIPLMCSAHGPINLYEGIEWMKALAMQLWYLCPATASITDSLISYEQVFDSDEFYAAPPTVPYVDTTNLDDSHPIYDLRYHLLQLFSKRSHPLESLLNPATHTCDALDHRLSWFLLQTLEALGYHHCAEYSENQLHVGFAAQLENNNLWEWAIFVLLHIKNRNQREIAVQQVLYRSVQVFDDESLSEKERFVVSELGVPEKWIDYAKAVRAGVIGNRHMQARYLLKAKQWFLANDVIFEHIVPVAFINNKLDYLKALLSRFERSEANGGVKVPNWANQGQVYLDYIDIIEKFQHIKALKTDDDIEIRWEGLKPQLADLCSRISLLPCPTAKHRLCQSEIAQNLAFLVRGVLLVFPVLQSCLVIKIAMERLPLPQEFAVKEMRGMLTNLVADLDDQFDNDSPMEV